MRHPASGMDDLDQRIDALYAGSPSEFTAGRDALAKDLRAAGQRDEADRVRRLRRPTKIAAELNRLARGEPATMAAAIEAEEALEAAQRGLLEGTGSADDLRTAERHEAEAVAALSPDPVIRAALRRAARSADARQDLRSGRISVEPEADPAVLFGMGPVSLPPRPAGPPPAKAATAPASSPARGDELAAVRAKRERASAREAAETAARAAVRAERAAQEELTRARRRATQAGTEARRAAEAAERVARQLAEAQALRSTREDEARAADAAEAAAEAAAEKAAAQREAAERAAAEGAEGGSPA
jgi:hypothetical protein